MESLIAQVLFLSWQNYELMTSKDSNFTIIHDLDSQLKEYLIKVQQKPQISQAQTLLLEDQKMHRKNPG
jgi:hypothetical protein